MINCRKETVRLLNKTFSEESYSNILLDSALSSQEMTQRDKRFITTLYYGVLEKKITLDYIISSYSSKKIEKLDMTVLNILRTGIYQIKYLDSVPDNAAVNECVKLVRSFRLASASGFVNAVLRNFIRDNAEYKEPEGKSERLSVKYSVAPWIADIITESYGEDFSDAFFERTTEKTPVYIRLNNTRADEAMLFEALGGIKAERVEEVPYCYRVTSGNLAGTEAFAKGYFHVQDISSQLACFALGAKEGDTVLDLCSAPGGKAFTIAQNMNGKGRVLAFDIYSQRAALIQSGADRLGLSNISTHTGDAAVHDATLEGADRVLCDVPCSGFGVLRKKPEIRYKKTESLRELYDIQYRILENAASYLRHGGELVYSTCTLNRYENEGITERFLEEHKDFERVPFFEEYGEPFGGYNVVLGAKGPDCDGFYISKIRRK